MEPVSVTALAAFLAPFFSKAGETLATEGVKLALEKRQDIKDGFVNLFKPEEIITLGLNVDQSPEQITSLVKANPETVAEIDTRIRENTELVREFEKILSRQEGRTIHAKYYIENVETGHFS